jgi:hypothetical protein
VAALTAASVASPMPPEISRNNRYLFSLSGVQSGIYPAGNSAHGRFCPPARRPADANGARRGDANEVIKQFESSVIRSGNISQRGRRERTGDFRRVADPGCPSCRSPGSTAFVRGPVRKLACECLALPIPSKPAEPGRCRFHWRSKGLDRTHAAFGLFPRQTMPRPP